MATAAELPLARRLRYRLEFVLVWSLALLFRALPIDAASALSGAMCRGIGPRLGVSRRASRNIRRALPEKSKAEVAAIVHGMWDNLGRTAAEALHLGHRRVIDDQQRFEIVGAEHLDRLQSDGQGGIIFTAHIGNWEAIGPLFYRRGLPLTTVYREANNPYVGALLTNLRRATNGARLVPKGAQGARGLIAALRQKHHLGLLVDQKLNDGVSVPFFAVEAMTAPALAQLAARFGVPMIPVHTVRLKGARVRIIVEPPFELSSGGAKDENAYDTMRRVNAHMEGWIRAHPEQWLWLHNRWPDEQQEETER